LDLRTCCMRERQLPEKTLSSALLVFRERSGARIPFNKLRRLVAVCVGGAVNPPGGPEASLDADRKARSSFLAKKRRNRRRRGSRAGGRGKVCAAIRKTIPPTAPAPKVQTIPRPLVGGITSPASVKRPALKERQRGKPLSRGNVYAPAKVLQPAPRKPSGKRPRRANALPTLRRRGLRGLLRRLQSRLFAASDYCDRKWAASQAAVRSPETVALNRLWAYLQRWGIAVDVEGFSAREVSVGQLPGVSRLRATQAGGLVEELWSPLRLKHDLRAEGSYALERG